MLDPELVVLAPDVGLDHRLVVLDLPRCAVGDLPAEVEHDDAIAEAHHGAHVVLDEQDGDAPIADASHHLHHPVRLLRVHAREGVVDDDVLQGAHLLEDRRLLERADHPLAGHQVGGEARDLLALEDHAAGRPREERGDQLEEGALAGAVRPDDAEHLALVRLERHVVDRHEAAEPLRQVAHLHDGQAVSAFISGRAGSRRLRSPLGSQSITVIMIAAYVSIWYSRRPWRSSKPRNRTKAPTTGPGTYESPPRTQ